MHYIIELSFAHILKRGNSESYIIFSLASSEKSMILATRNISPNTVVNLHQANIYIIIDGKSQEMLLNICLALYTLNYSVAFFYLRG